jgi:hypothetical protein
MAYGYDMVTTLGSNLLAGKTTAGITGGDPAKIINQNFGFDNANGKQNVTLNPDTPHYFMETQG